MDNNEILLKTLQKENKLIIEKCDRLENKYKQFEEKYSHYEEDYYQIKKLNEELLKERNLLREQLDSILYSRSYKAVKKIKKILGR